MTIYSNSQEIKVLGFDSWTGGSRNFERLIEPLKKYGIHFKLIHLGSWGGDRGRPKEEKIQNLLVRDISFYGKKSFSEIIDLEKPSAVLFLSTDTFAHRAFNRLCRSRNIPSIHLYHGLMLALAFDAGQPYQPNMFNYFIFVFSRLVKMVTKVWPTYIHSLIDTDSSVRDWTRFITDNFDLLLGKKRINSARDAKTDLCLVYTDADADHAVPKYGFKRNEVIAVGNPDIIQFKLEEFKFAIGVSKDQSKLSDVMYIDTALVLRGATFSNTAEFIAHLDETRKVLTASKKHLVLKLHPDHFRTDLPDVLRQMGIGICENDKFVHRLGNCCAAIIEPSSAAVIPALMGLPLLLAKYGKLSHQLYGKILTNYPRARELYEIGQFIKILEEEQTTCDEEQVKSWISINSGPLPAENMADRVAAQIIKSINEKSASFEN